MLYMQWLMGNDVFSCRCLTGNFVPRCIAKQLACDRLRLSPVRYWCCCCRRQTKEQPTVRSADEYEDEHCLHLKRHRDPYPPPLDFETMPDQQNWADNNCETIA